MQLDLGKAPKEDSREFYYKNHDVGPQRKFVRGPKYPNGMDERINIHRA
jgi:hypothetical protein